MHRFEVLFTLFLVTQPTLGTVYTPGKLFSPRKYADVSQVARRDCVPAAPNVSASAVGLHAIYSQQLLLTSLSSLRTHADRTTRSIPQHAQTRCRYLWKSRAWSAVSNRGTLEPNSSSNPGRVPATSIQVFTMLANRQIMVP